MHSFAACHSTARLAAVSFAFANFTAILHRLLKGFAGKSKNFLNALL
jgi:hypothetical protein